MKLSSLRQLLRYVDVLLCFVCIIVSTFQQDFAARSMRNHSSLQSFCIRLYTGQIHNMNPPNSICVTQGAMVYASGGMVGISSLIFTVHVSF